MFCSLANNIMRLDSAWVMPSYISASLSSKIKLKQTLQSVARLLLRFYSTAARWTMVTFTDQVKRNSLIHSLELNFCYSEQCLRFAVDIMKTNFRTYCYLGLVQIDFSRLSNSVYTA